MPDDWYCQPMGLSMGLKWQCARMHSTLSEVFNTLTNAR
jgi:hypothetical protein